LSCKRKAFEDINIGTTLEMYDVYIAWNENSEYIPKITEKGTAGRNILKNKGLFLQLYNK